MLGRPDCARARAGNMLSPFVALVLRRSVDRHHHLAWPTGLIANTSVLAASRSVAKSVMAATAAPSEAARPLAVGGSG
eukprot:1951298-Alexandrium_andersonii.AAC.1